MKAAFTILTLMLAGAAAFAGIEFFRRYCLMKDWLDVPNERSSHVVPTPRGAGIVIVVISLVGYAAIAILFQNSFSWGYFSGALIIATVSWLDDLYSLPSGTRLFATS